jgi:hypothetical protein
MHLTEPIFVIGMGEVGRRLAGALEAAGAEVLPVTRQTGWEAAASPSPGARLVCVGEAGLGEVLERLRPAPDDSLILVQNGWIRPELAGLAGYTRGLLWFNSKKSFFKVLRSSPFGGPWAKALTEALATGGIPANSVDDTTFRAAEAEKMGFNCVVGLPLVVHGVSLAEYLERESVEAEAVFREAVTVCAKALGVEPAAGWWPAFVASAAPLGGARPSAPKALQWRNGAVVRLAGELGLAAPANARLLAAVTP